MASRHRLLSQQLPDLPPHLPPARPPRRPHQTRSLQGHLRQPWPGNSHAQLPWEACQGHKDNGASRAAWRGLHCVDPLRPAWRSWARAARWLLGGPWACGAALPGIFLGMPILRPPGPTQPGPASHTVSRGLRAFPRWLFTPWRSAPATHSNPWAPEILVSRGQQGATCEVPPHWKVLCWPMGPAAVLASSAHGRSWRVLS